MLDLEGLACVAAASELDKVFPFPGEAPYEVVRHAHAAGGRDCVVDVTTFQGQEIDERMRFVIRGRDYSIYRVFDLKDKQVRRALRLVEMRVAYV